MSSYSYYTPYNKVVNYDTFQATVWEEGARLFRPMPWRSHTDPYSVLVSELMLQQTQVERVIPKFELFMRTFPTLEALAAAPLSDVLTAWSGLGYNRRAKFLHAAAQQVVARFDGVIPATYDALVSLPGIGPNTAGALLAYSFNQPAVFIETNVRTVYFYHLFEAAVTVSDAELRAAVTATVDQEHPREWYWALMDYGSYLKRQGNGQLDKSKHYKKQAPLKGSLREVRGLIIKYLTKGPATIAALQAAMPADERFTSAFTALVDEGMITVHGSSVRLV